MPPPFACAPPSMWCRLRRPPRHTLHPYWWRSGQSAVPPPTSRDLARALKATEDRFARGHISSALGTIPSWRDRSIALVKRLDLLRADDSIRGDLGEDRDRTLEQAAKYALLHYSRFQAGRVLLALDSALDADRPGKGWALREAVARWADYCGWDRPAGWSPVSGGPAEWEIL